MSGGPCDATIAVASRDSLLTALAQQYSPSGIPPCDIEAQQRFRNSFSSTSLAAVILLHCRAAESLLLHLSCLEPDRTYLPVSSMKILDLPPEVFAHIASFTAETLPSLRLVSKEMQIASFDAWAMHYLYSKMCCVVDRSRLASLKRITASPHLVKELKQVIITINPMSGEDPEGIVALALNKDDDPRQARLWAFTKAAWDHFDTVYEQGFDENLLVSVLMDLKHAGRLQRLSVRLCSRFAPGGKSVWFSQVARGILHSVLVSGLQIDQLVLEERGDTRVQMDCFEVPGLCDIPNMVSKLDKFVYQAPPEVVMNDLTAYLDLSMGILNILKHSTQLRQLTLRNLETPIEGSIHPPPEMAMFAGHILLSNSFHQMRHLYLTSFHCRTQDLELALRRCQPTLSTLELIGITLHASDPRPWREIFLVLRDCVDLDHVKFSDLRHVINGRLELPMYLLPITDSKSISVPLQGIWYRDWEKDYLNKFIDYMI